MIDSLLCFGFVLLLVLLLSLVLNAFGVDDCQYVVHAFEDETGKERWRL